MTQMQLADVLISIHAPRTGSDTISDAPRGGGSIFQSTLPARGATSIIDGVTGSIDISIHAPRTGSDRDTAALWQRAAKFQSTLPARGATSKVYEMPPHTQDFNPRSPHGERRNSIRPRLAL